ncbi:electron transport complex subunit RsxB [Polaromonas jejuensis]|uniref:Electron transport complex subunit RsxB n=1 Tax=Polaromonas jejuensis TaxID=457502 RepID=A0ABW0QGI3_9BURK|nr:electron transport complex subunit RsxB [Polaromonas jejuensis]
MSPPAESLLFDRINAALPQTQCTRCGYPDCAAYAQAIAAGEAAINQCPPGGAEGIARLAAITGLPVQPLNPANGVEGPRAVAIIDENWCIGCTLCIKACPTDAIVGSNKMMHTVIEPYCTGCELCVPVCPVDCISLENVTGTRTGWSAWSQAEADTARSRYEFHSYQRSLDKGQSPKKLEKMEKAPQPADSQAPGNPARSEADAAVAERKRAVIEAALARARAQREQKT